MKFKKFPKIYRFITESPFLTVLFLAIFLVIFIFLGLDVVGNAQKKAQLDSERKKITSQIEYWQKVVGKYKDYRDGYFELAVLEYQLGNKEASKKYAEKVLLLDPNFEKAKLFLRSF